MLPINTEPLALISLHTHQPIATALIVPRYTSSKGISSGGGHGPGSMKHKVFIAHPFLYEQGQEFRPYEGEATGLLALGTWSGKAITLDGVTVIAPGYQSFWIWDLWSRDSNVAHQLVPLSQEKAILELEEFLVIFTNPIIEGKTRRRWSLGGTDSIAVLFTEEEQSTVVQFIQSAIDSNAQNKSVDSRGERSNKAFDLAALLSRPWQQDSGTIRDQRPEPRSRQRLQLNANPLDGQGLAHPMSVPGPRYSRRVSASAS